MSSAVAAFVMKELMALAECESIGEDETLSSLGFSSNDFVKLWENAKKKFPSLSDTKVSQWAVDEPISDLLKRLSEETKHIK